MFFVLKACEPKHTLNTMYVLPIINRHQWNKCYSIGTNRTNRTNGRVECTPTQPEANGNILSPCIEMHFTNGIPME